MHAGDPPGSSGPRKPERAFGDLPGRRKPPAQRPEAFEPRSLR